MSASITFSSCFYIIKSKFDVHVYVEWMNNFLSIVHNFKLVVYTNEESVRYINTRENPNIKIVIKPITQFYNYQYKEDWIKNHKKNSLLNNRTCWELNMLWSEKLWFVSETIKNAYFETDYYGWCDIGYFRNRHCDTNTSLLHHWPNSDKIQELDKTKIHYACVLPDDSFLNYLYQLVKNKNSVLLPKDPIPADQVSIAGGFFILHKDKIDWWTNTFDTKLQLYFQHNYLVKDDQMIIVDCILSDTSHFKIIKENTPPLDNWFLFQRFLL